MYPLVLYSCLCFLAASNAQDNRIKRQYPNIEYIVQQPNTDEYQEYYNSYAYTSSGLFQKFFPHLVTASTPELLRPENAFTSTHVSQSSQVPYGYNVNTYPAFYQGSSSENQQYKPVFDQKYQYESKYPSSEAVFTSGSLPTITPSVSAFTSASTSTVTDNNKNSASAEAISNAVVNISDKNNLDVSSSASAGATSNTLSSAESEASTFEQAEAVSSAQTEALFLSTIAQASSGASAETTSTSSNTAFTNAESSSNAEAQVTTNAVASANAEASSIASARPASSSSATAFTNVEGSSSASAQASSSATATSNANTEALSTILTGLPSRLPSLADSDAENGVFLLAVPSDSSSVSTSGERNGNFKILHLAIPTEILQKLLSESSSNSETKMLSTFNKMIATAMAHAESSSTANASSGSSSTANASSESSSTANASSKSSTTANASSESSSTANASSESSSTANASSKSSATASASSASFESILEDRDSFKNNILNVSTPESAKTDDKVTKLSETTTGIPLSAEKSTDVTLDSKDVFLIPIDENSGYFSQFLPEYFYTSNPAAGNGQVIFATSKDQADFFKNYAAGQTVKVVGTKVSTDTTSPSLDKLISQVFKKPAEISLGNRSGDEDEDDQKVSFVVNGIKYPKNGSKYPKIVIRYPNSKVVTSSTYAVQSNKIKPSIFRPAHSVYGNFGGVYQRYGGYP